MIAVENETYSDYDFDVAPLFAYTSKKVTSPTRTTLKQMTKIIKDPKYVIIDPDQLFTQTELRNHYSGSERLNPVPNGTSIEFKTDAALKLKPHLFCSSSAFPPNFPFEITVKFYCSFCLKSHAADIPSYSQDDFLKLGYLYGIKLINRIFLKNEKTAQTVLGKMLSELLQGLKKYSEPLYEQVTKLRVRDDQFDEILNKLTRKTASEKVGKFYFVSLGMVLAGTEAAIKNYKSNEFVIKIADSVPGSPSATPSRDRSKRPFQLAGGSGDTDFLNKNIGYTSVGLESDYGLDRAIMLAVSNTSLPFDPNATKQLQKAKAAFKDKSKRLAELEQTFNDRLQYSENEEDKLQAIFDLEHIKIVEKDNKKDLAKRKKCVVIGQAYEISHARDTVCESNRINKKWRELSERRSDCIENQLNISEQNNMPEIKTAISATLGELKKIEDEKCAFLGEMERKTSTLLSRLEELLIEDPYAIDINQELAYKVIQKVSEVYQIPLQDRTLDISSDESLDDSQDPTWLPETSAIEIAGIYSGKHAANAAQSNTKKRTFSKTNESPKSPILHPKRRVFSKRGGDSLSPCASPFHTCHESCDGTPGPSGQNIKLENKTLSPSQCSFDRLNTSNQSVASNFSDLSDDAFTALCEKSLPKPKI